MLCGLSLLRSDAVVLTQGIRGRGCCVALPFLQEEDEGLLLTCMAAWDGEADSPLPLGCLLFLFLSLRALPFGPLLSRSPAGVDQLNR